MPQIHHEDHTGTLLRGTWEGRGSGVRCGVAVRPALLRASCACSAPGRRPLLQNQAAPTARDPWGTGSRGTWRGHRVHPSITHAASRPALHDSSNHPPAPTGSPVPPAPRAGCSCRAPAPLFVIPQRVAPQGRGHGAEFAVQQQPCSQLRLSAEPLRRCSGLPHPHGSATSCISPFRSRVYVGATAFVLPPSSHALLQKAALLDALCHRH